MNRLTRVNTIWRKELIDTLRDRRTLIAMILVPMALYPAMILGSLQGFELQISRLKQEEYKVAVTSEDTARWLRTAIDSDPARRPGAESQPAEVIVEKDQRGELPAEEPASQPVAKESSAEAAREDVRRHPPPYVIEIADRPDQVIDAVKSGQVHAGLLVADELPTADGDQTSQLTLVLDQTDIRSQLAAAGIESILERASEYMLRQRLRREELAPSFIQPLAVKQDSVAPPEKVGGSILGQIVPLILIIMTITGAIYPAIDLTAGERERGTLETLMVAPVPTVDLITGKFIVVALIGMLSATLNLLSIGGTVYLGGLGDLLTRGNTVVIPLHVLPWVLVVLIPLAVMFSAVLLAVCSFARSFKEAQNYVMPVMVAALIPAVVGVLPGTRLEGPLLIMPVTNIVILTRDLFMGKVEVGPIVWVTLSTTLYAGAAVAVAARLFGQEAVLFADSGSVKTLFQRRFFKPAPTPTAAQALLIVALVFSLNFFAQQSLGRLGVTGTWGFWIGFAVILVVLLVLLPVGAATYLRADLRTTFALRRPPPLGLLAGLCFGASTWILARAVLVIQSQWLTMPPEYEKLGEMLDEISPMAALFLMAILPAVCEELFFRGYALNGLRSALNKPWSVLIVAAAFAVSHHSIFRLAVTAGLGILFGLLVVQYRSIWPAMLAHLMHNGISVLTDRIDTLKAWLAQAGFMDSGETPLPWVLGALVLTVIGVVICVYAPERTERRRVDLTPTASSEL